MTDLRVEETHRASSVVGGRKPTYLTSVLTSVKANSVVPSGGKKIVSRGNTDVRWVGFHPLLSCAQN